MFEQGLFWHIVDPSLPEGISNNLGFLEHSLQSTYLKKYFKDPDSLDSFVVFTGTTSIDFSGLEEILTDSIVDNFNSHGIEIYLYEPMSLYSINDSLQYNRFYFSEFSSKDKLADMRAGELDSITEFAKKHNLTNVNVSTCDYNVELFNDTYPELTLKCRDIFIRATGSIQPQQKTLKRVTKKFWCANARYAVHRHAIVSYLADKPGAYSWHFICEQPSTNIPGSWIDRSQLTKPQIKSLRHGNQILNSNYNYLDFRYKERETISRGDSYHFAEAPNSVGGLRKYFLSYSKCFVAVVNETRFAQPTGNISEKVLYAIASSSPFILVAPPRSLEYLHKLGFKTFNKFWDESYDLEEDHTKRLKMIFDIFDEINNLPVKHLRFYYKKMQPILKHNNKILAELHKDDSTTRGTQ